MKSNDNITVNLDTVGAIAYLNQIGYPHDFKDEESIDKAFIICSKDYLSGKINTLIYCSVINKLFYIDVIKFQIKLSEQNLDSLLNNLSELQYYELINDQNKIRKCHDELNQYLAIKNRE